MPAGGGPAAARSGVASIVIAGGHSAGHIEPAMNVADAIRRRDPAAVITAIGTERGLDTTLIPARGYPLQLIPPVPLPRKPNLDLLRTPGRVASSVRAAGAVLDQVGARVVVGFGSYVALPTYLAARRRRIPIVIHEANARAGIANRVASYLTHEVYTATASVRIAHAHPVGMPLRPAIVQLDRLAERAAARARFGLAQGLPTLLVTGGSQGAVRINQAMLGAQRELAESGVQVLHIPGPKNPVTPPPRGAGEPAYVVVPYLEDMASGYAAADFVLCRSGAMTVAELAAVGLPAAYVPLPLRGGEQGSNAEPIVAAGGGLLVADEQLTPDWIVATVLPVLLDAGRLAAMSQAARQTGARDAADVMAARILELAHDS
ncbi:MAG TPA: UDP-N-acetylglucosamine--N-acetylmuramyl-(pentapeptide) pyrophosphoryl-undecaprenol N-acetylglucosamine transferase [Jatrophihabitans sp.]|nr:UDP-N-acetylglucosamine--N-acetylmuramyl-(pentapeptide) pyrophosphoryl-undecaprenol N-acetylglucosamine transferase [Jatrophihabitans sp.]